jgi:hypothetical protein
VFPLGYYSITPKENNMTTRTETTYPLTWTPEEINNEEQRIETAKSNAKRAPHADPIYDWNLLATRAPEGITPGLVAELVLTHWACEVPAARCMELFGAQALADEVNGGGYDFQQFGIDKLQTTATALLKAAQRRGLAVYDPPMVLQFQGFSVSL